MKTEDEDEDVEAQVQAIRVSGCSGRVEDFVNDVFTPLSGQTRNGAPVSPELWHRRL